MPRFKDTNWDFTATPDGGMQTWEQAQVAVLMDIRDELKRLNHLLNCPNFTSIPHKLESIRKNTTKRRKRK